MLKYKEFIEQITTLLNRTKYVVLATANKKGIVTASQMCMIVDGLDVYFQTSTNFEKTKNIKENPNIAITIGNTYFKGKATITGHPSENKKFIKKMKSKHIETYKNYSKLPEQVLIKVKLTECRIWKIWNKNTEKGNIKEEAILILNLKNKSIKKIKCDNIFGGF